MKFKEDKNFPKFRTHDNESFIELTYKCTDEEFRYLKDDYKDADNCFRVRKILKTEDSSFADKIKPAQSNLFAYEEDKLSTNFFYGAKNISSAKLGRILFVPEISIAEDNLKMSGPSPLRDTINLIMSRVVKSGNSYDELVKSFTAFNKSLGNDILL